MKQVVTFPRRDQLNAGRDRRLCRLRRVHDLASFGVCAPKAFARAMADYQALPSDDEIDAFTGKAFWSLPLPAVLIGFVKFLSDD